MSLELRLARTLLTHLVARRKLFGILARPDVNTRIGSTDDSGAQRVRIQLVSERLRGMGGAWFVGCEIVRASGYVVSHHQPVMFTFGFWFCFVFMRFRTRSIAVREQQAVPGERGDVAEGQRRDAAAADQQTRNRCEDHHGRLCDSVAAVARCLRPRLPCLEELVW